MFGSMAVEGNGGDAGEDFLFSGEELQLAAVDCKNIAGDLHMCGDEMCISPWR